MPDELANLLQNFHCGCIPARPHSSCSDRRPYKRVLDFNYTDHKVRRPFYNVGFNYSSLIVSNQALLLKRQSGQKQEDILTNGLGFSVVFVRLLPFDPFLHSYAQTQPHPNNSPKVGQCLSLCVMNHLPNTVFVALR